MNNPIFEYIDRLIYLCSKAGISIPKGIVISKEEYISLKMELRINPYLQLSETDIENPNFILKYKDIELQPSQQKVTYFTTAIKDPKDIKGVTKNAITIDEVQDYYTCSICGYNTSLAEDAANHRGVHDEKHR